MGLVGLTYKASAARFTEWKEVASQTLTDVLRLIGRRPRGGVNSLRPKRDEAYAKGTTGPEASSGRDWQSCAYCQDGDGRERGSRVPATRQGPLGQGGGKSACRKHDSRRTARGGQEGGEREVGVMTVSVLSAAKTLAEMTDWNLSNLEMNKILYLAHMLRLG